MTSQTTTPSTNNGSYRVKVGDSNRYDILKVKYLDKNYLQSSIQLKNGSLMSYNMTKGMYITVKVVTINTTSNGNEQVYVEQGTYIQGKGIIYSGAISSTSVISLGFGTYSDAESYYNQSYNQPYYSFTRNGDLISVTRTYNSSVYQNNSLTLFTNFKISINWKTGWLESENLKYYYSNGTTVTELQLQRHSSDLINLVTNYSFNILAIGSVLTVFAVPVLLGISYRSFSKLSKSSGNKQTFPDYFKNQFKYSKKKTKQKSITQTDKALKMIELIIDDSKNNVE